jgi:hypothetical protein
MIVNCGKNIIFFLHTQTNRLLTKNNIYIHTFIQEKFTHKSMIYINKNKLSTYFQLTNNSNNRCIYEF